MMQTCTGLSSGCQGCQLPGSSLEAGKGTARATFSEMRTMNLERTLELPNPSPPFTAEEQRTRKLRRLAQGHWAFHKQNIIPMCSSDLDRFWFTVWPYQGHWTRKWILVSAAIKEKQWFLCCCTVWGSNEKMHAKNLINVTFPTVLILDHASSVSTSISDMCTLSTSSWTVLAWVSGSENINTLTKQKRVLVLFFFAS